MREGKELRFEKTDHCSEISLIYYVLGRVTNRSINGGSNSDSWTFDAMSRVTAESNVLGSFAFAYVDDVSGYSKGTTRLASVTYPNSQVTNYSRSWTLISHRDQRRRASILFI